MSDKSLRFMDKTQLLNIMRQQELEIERLNEEVEKLTSGKNEQIGDLTHGSEQQLAEKDAQIKMLGEEIEKLSAEKTEQANRLIGETSRLNAEISRLRTENGELAAAKNESGQTEALLAEKNEQIERQNARIIRLTVEKDEQGKEVEKLLAEKSEQAGQIEKLAAEKEELAELSQIAANRQPQFPLENPGSLAEASISVAGVMQAAQEAADVYLQNIKVVEAEKAAAAQKIEQEAKERANAIVRAAELKCKELEEAENKALSDIRNVSFLYMDFIDKSHSALHEMIDRYKLTKLAQND